MSEDEPTNTLTETGMESTKEQREKAAEKFAKGIEDLKAAGDPTDFAQERVRTTPEHKSDLAADDDLYPEDVNDDEGEPGREPGTEQDFKEKKDKKVKGNHPTPAEKDAAATRQAKTEHVPPAKA